MFDGLIVAVLKNPAKTRCSASRSGSIFREAVNGDLARQVKTSPPAGQVRAGGRRDTPCCAGCGAVSDFEYEFQCQHERKLDPGSRPSS